MPGSRIKSEYKRRRTIAKVPLKTPHAPLCAAHQQQAIVRNCMAMSSEIFPHRARTTFCVDEPLARIDP
jgi:hypothetical protein